MGQTDGKGQETSSRAVSEVSARRILMQLNAEQWRDVFTAAPNLGNILVKKVPGRQSWEVRGRLWIQRESHLTQVAEVYHEDIVERLSYLGDLDDLSEARKYLQQVVREFGSGPATFALIGLVCNASTESEMGTRLEELRELIANTPEGVPTPPIEPTDADPTRVDAAPDEQPSAAVDEEALESLTARIVHLQERKEDLLSRILPDLTETIQAGCVTDGTAEVKLAAWDMELQEVLTQTNGLVGGLEKPSLPACISALEVLIAAQAVRQDKLVRLKALKESEGQLRKTIAESPAEVQKYMRPGLDQLVQEIAQLEAALVSPEDGTSASLSGDVQAGPDPVGEPELTLPASGQARSGRDIESVDCADSISPRGRSDAKTPPRTVDNQSYLEEDSESAEAQQDMGLTNISEALNASYVPPVAEGTTNTKLPTDDSGESAPQWDDQTSESHESPDEAVDVAAETNLNTRLIQTLVADGRFAEAYWVTLLGSDAHMMVLTLRYAAAAFSVGLGGMTSVQVHGEWSHVDEALTESLDPDAITTALAATARAVLSEPYYPLCDVMDQLLDLADLDSHWHSALKQVANGTRNGYRHSLEQRPGQISEELQRARREAVELQESLRHSVNQFKRAADTARRLAREDEPWGRALHLAASVEPNDLSGLNELRELVRTLADKGALDNMIDRADAAGAGPRARNNRIVASARRRLQRQGADVLRVANSICTLLAAADEIAERPQIQRIGAAIRAAFEELPDSQTVDLGHASLHALRTWVLDPKLGLDSGDLETILLRASLPLHDVARDEQNVIERGELVAPERLNEAFMAPFVAEQVAQAYADIGNIALAETVLSDNGLNTSVLDQQTMRLSAQHQRDVENARLRFATFRANNLLDPRSQVEVNELLAQLEQLETQQDKRFDLADRRCRQFQQRLDTEISLSKRAAEQRLIAIPDVSPSDVDRVQGLIDIGELATASEFLADLESGRPLPMGQEDGDRLLKDFLSVLPQLSQEEDVEKLAIAFGGVDAGVERASRGLNAWRELTTGRKAPVQSARAVMRLIGLDAIEEPYDITPAGMGGMGYRTLKVHARPTDSSIVPGLGTMCEGRYLVTVFRERRHTAGLVLDAVADGDRNAANIILYPGLMSLEMRRDLLTEARRRHITALFVDAAAIAFVAAKTPGSFLGLQRITLPFSVFDHWGPDVAGQVPDEVFVGRREELAEILNPSGSLFVYGGRQLGKSALLRKAARQFGTVPNHHALYFDLKSLGIGEYNEPDHLWIALADELRRRDILTSNVTNPQSITKKIQEWLEADVDRRLLLLLDESDLFLEAESKLRNEGGRMYRFRNVGLLKALMENSGRRFKPVFAGLHQVQRFHDISNTPLAHGGRDVLVGPLNREEARELAQAPFESLGYEFQSPDLMWVLLSFTNYQANLIQIACHALLGRLRSRRPKNNEPPTPITNDDVRAIVASRDVRDRIAEKFNLTVRLEDRYKVIALVLAVNTLQDRFSKAYDPQELLIDCALWWEQGFKGMRRKEFERYLDEMVGLGVLVRREGMHRPVAFRSPNVVPMLGSQDEIEAELQDGASTFDLPHDYNPLETRRRLADGSHSPLTEDDLGQLLPTNDREATNTYAIVGSPACGIDRVAETLKSVAEDRDLVVREVPASEWREFLTETARMKSRRPIPIIRLASDSQEDVSFVEDVTTHCQKIKSRAFFILWPEAVDVLRGSVLRDAERLTLRGWSDEGLRSWENPFNTRPQRPALLDATNGWPVLVDRAIRAVESGKAADEAIRMMVEFPADAESATVFLSDVGVPAASVDLLSAWAAYSAMGEEVPLDDLMEISQSDTEEMGRALASLQDLGLIEQNSAGYQLDKVVWRCFKRLALEP